MGIEAGTAATLLVNGQDRVLASASRFAATGAMHKSKAMSVAQADQVSKDFEAMFIGQMLEQMFGDSVGDELFGDRTTKEVYKGLMVEEYGKQIARSGGIGIAEFVKRELLTLQEIAS